MNFVHEYCAYFKTQVIMLC